MIEGKVWKCGDGLDAYKIIGKNRWTLDQLDPHELGKWVFEGEDPGVKNIPWGFKNKGYEVVIAGKDFGGGGKSIEHPVVAMKGAGIKVTVAESFARYNFRNSINLGLPAIRCQGVTRIFKTGERARVNLLTGEVKNMTTGEVAFGVPLSDFVFELIASGSLLEFTKRRLKGDISVR